MFFLYRHSLVDGNDAELRTTDSAGGSNMKKLYLFTAVLAAVLVAQPGYTSTLSRAQTRSLTTVGPDVHLDPYNPGYYNIGFQPDNPRAPYSIEYISATGYIGISLNKLPLRTSRLSAEMYLMHKIGMTKQQMCHLDYQVAVPNFVSSRYSGMNLGFSFCPHAVRLP